MEEDNKIALPHHEQESLCTTRLPYRQGRKFTAVKVYSITNESNHLLIFGIPSLNLRQEAKALFIKFGKLIQFRISNEHVNEVFTDTYHAQYEKIQSARMAKRMLDTKTFYGGSLHVTYAPELESVEETKQKLMQRQLSVMYRLRNIEKEDVKKQEVVVKEDTAPVKLNMGELNTIMIGPQKKRKIFKKRTDKTEIKNTDNVEISNTEYKDHEDIMITTDNVINNTDNKTSKKDIDIIDCTNVNIEVISNINDALNYNKFGNETIRKVPEKTVNKIKFHINKKS